MRHPMATFTRFELSDARAVGRSFGIEVSAVAPVPAGSVNSNYRLETVAGESFLARIYEEQAQDKPEEVRPKIAEGRLAKWLDEHVLLRQPHVNADRYDGQTIEQLRSELAAKTGENVVVRRFQRFVVGAD